MDRLAHLNAAQREAVLTLSGPLLVLAGAGTGKTRVITHRMAELIRHKTAPDRILSVTFTNKAAGEMQERTAALLGRRLPKKPWISTFHSLCVRILREDITVLGYPAAFTIFDRGDQEAAARTALRDIRVADRMLRPGDLLATISRWKTRSIFPAHASRHAENDADFVAAVAYRKYQANLEAQGALDFDDLLLLTNRLFNEFPDVAKRHQSRFDHVQIDEYQDTNQVQFELVAALVREHQNLCVVGDDDQSIYGWRGADVRHILGFQSYFANAKVIRLEENYRCTDKILDVANRLVRHNRGRHPKKLIAHKQSQDDVRCLEFEDELAEAEGIVQEIRYLVEERNVSIDDVAILFRTNEQPRPFETELRRAKLPYVLIGGQSFFDRREIRDMLAYLKVLARPDEEMSLLRIINTPARGIGAATVRKLMDRAVKRGCRLWDVIPDAAACGDISNKAVDALNAFRALLKRFERQFEERPKQLSDTLHEMIDAIDYEGEIQKQYKKPDQQLARSAMLDQLIDTVKEYTQRTKKPSLAGFLEETALTGRDEESDKEDELSKPALKLMTLHSAKGLEYPRVYMVGLEEGLLPHRRSVEADGAAIDEERRLAYVGITRAEDFLTISRAASRMKWGKRRPSPPSRFLFEMSGDNGQEKDSSGTDAM